MSQKNSKLRKPIRGDKKPGKLAPGVAKQPSDEEFTMSEREKNLLEQLFDWGERSEKTPWVLGQPLGFRS